jgi:hypothetical protein
MHRTKAVTDGRFAPEMPTFTKGIVTILGQRLLKAHAALAHACIARPA